MLKTFVLGTYTPILKRDILWQFATSFRAYISCACHIRNNLYIL